MNRDASLLGREEVRSPAVLLFGAVYLFASILGFLKDAAQTAVYIGMSLGILLLIWLVFGLTEKLRVTAVPVRRVGLELVFAGLVYLSSHYVPLPRLEFGQKWWASSILRNEFFFFLLPFLFLRLRKYSLRATGLSTVNWKRNLTIGAIVFACMAIPSSFLVSDAASLILGGRLSVLQAFIGFWVLFVHNIFLAGLPEEFFYRAFVQTRLCTALKSNLGGILMTALLFGLVHISAIQRWYPGITLSEAFCRAFFIQGMTSLVEGALWFRTQSLLPGIMVHSGINALNNLGSVVPLLFE